MNNMVCLLIRYLNPKSNLLQMRAKTTNHITQDQLVDGIHQCNYTNVYREPLHQSSFKCKPGRLRWPAILVPLMLWNQLNALVDMASKIHTMFSSTVKTRQGPKCTILHRDQGGSWITGPT